MKKSFFAAVFSTLGLASCTKVVQIDLNNSNPQYVIEGDITNDDNLQSVHITRSVNFSDINSYPAVTNAVVIISDDAGNVDTLLQAEPGYYQTANVRGVPGRTYNLEVLVDGIKFSASSTMPHAVYIDTVTVADQLSFGKMIEAPVVTFQDPPATGNFYCFTVYRDQHRLRSLYVDNDMANNGGVINRSLPDADSSYAAGDAIRVDMQCISKEMYEYYFSLQQTIGQSSATPANPVINISGGHVLGYFSAHTTDRRHLVVQ